MALAESHDLALIATDGGHISGHTRYKACITMPSQTLMAGHCSFVSLITALEARLGAAQQRRAGQRGAYPFVNLNTASGSRAP